MKTIGMVLWIAGVVLLAIGWFMPTTVSSDPAAYLSTQVVNLDLQQHQLIAVLTGLALIITGALLHGMSVALDRIAPAAAADLATPTISAARARTAPEMSFPITAPNEAEQPHMVDIRAYGIQRTASGRYRGGGTDYDTVQEAVTAASAVPR